MNWVYSVMENFLRIHLRHIKLFKDQYFWVWAQIRHSKFLLWGWIRFQNYFFFKLLNNDDVKWKKNYYKLQTSCMLRKSKLILSSKISNLVQLLVSIWSLFWFLIIHTDFLQIFWNFYWKDDIWRIVSNLRINSKKIRNSK